MIFQNIKQIKEMTMKITFLFHFEKINFLQSSWKMSPFKEDRVQNMPYTHLILQIIKNKYQAQICWFIQSPAAYM